MNHVLESILPSNVGVPKLLVSVRDEAEAMVALQAGVDILDIKDPSQGPMGRASAATIGRILRKRCQTPVSVALGELHQPLDDDLLRLVKQAAFVKVALAGEACDPQTGWRDRLAVLAHRLGPGKLVPVAYADAQAVNAPSPQAVLNWAIEHRSSAILMDTADKAGPGLLEDAAGPDHQDQVASWVAKAKEAGIAVALAGKLRGLTLPRARALAPAIVGVRSAVCAGGDRSGQVDANCIREVKQRLTGDALRL